MTDVPTPAHETTSEVSGFPSSYRVTVPVAGELFEGDLRRRRQLQCDHITCVTDSFRTATVCFHIVEPPMPPEGDDEQLMKPEDLKKSKPREECANNRLTRRIKSVCLIPSNHTFRAVESPSCKETTARRKF